MAKAKSRFVCTQCGAEYPKWQGQCHDCGAWNALEEQAVATDKAAGGVRRFFSSPVSSSICAAVPGG